MDASSSAPEFHFDTGQALHNLFIACHTRKMTFCMLHKKKEGGKRAAFSRSVLPGHTNAWGDPNLKPCSYQGPRRAGNGGVCGGPGVEGVWCLHQLDMCCGAAAIPDAERVSLVTAERCSLARECHGLVTSASVPPILSAATHRIVVCGNVGSVSPGHVIFY